MAGWRRSRLTRRLAALPVLGRLPVVRLESALARARRLRLLYLEARVRFAAWLQAGKRWGAAASSDVGSGSRFRKVARWARFATRPAALALFLPRAPSSPAGAAARAWLPGVEEPTLRGIARPWGQGAGNQDCVVAHASHTDRRRIAVYASSVGNFFHAEMADLVAHGLAASGAFAVERRDETQEPPDDAAEHLVLAPHEFFGLGGGFRFAAPAYRPFRRRCTLLLAEQPGTSHFVVCLPFAVEVKLVLDLNPASARALRRAGLPAAFFPIGYVPGLEDYAWRRPLPAGGVTEGISLVAARSEAGAEDVFEQRPIDVIFMGVLTPRRTLFFAEHAAFFASRRCFLSLPTPLVPLGGGVPSMLAPGEATALSQRAKILLNIHRSDVAYFEWHRLVIRGFWQKTLVVSEPSPLPAGFRSGVHLLEEELSRIPELLRWLLETEEGRLRADEVRHAAHRALLERYHMRDWGRELAAFYAGEGAPPAIALEECGRDGARVPL